LHEFENRYGKFNRNALYGRIDDMILLEWEGELETLKKLGGEIKVSQGYHF